MPAAVGESRADNSNAPPTSLKPVYFLAWLLCAIFYGFQYAVRSAPGVMQAELAQAWGGNRMGAMISAYYVAYALMALVAGLLLDRYGARRTIPVGIAVVAVGCLVFAQGSETVGMGGFTCRQSARYSPLSARPMWPGATYRRECWRFSLASPSASAWQAPRSVQNRCTC
jgi:hypothetical protein